MKLDSTYTPGGSEWKRLEEVLEHVVVGRARRPLTSTQRRAFLLTGHLPRDARIPAMLSPEAFLEQQAELLELAGDSPYWRQQLSLPGADSRRGPVSGPYAVDTGGGHYARQIRQRAKAA